MKAPAPPPPFHLSKWYLDCQNASSVVVVYVAEVRLGLFSLRSACLWHVRQNHPPLSRFTFAPGRLRPLDPDGLSVELPRLDFAGHWEPAADPIHRRLLSASTGNVDWHCVAPRARVQMRIGKDTVEGDGYAERLDLTMCPWKLPIHELRWGRFHDANGGFVVWISWQGPCPLLLVWRNGTMEQAPELTRNGLRIGDDQLELSGNYSIRAGQLGDTSIAFLPAAIRRRLPKSIFQIHEAKWAGTGRLNTNGTSLDGTAIYETVRFPQLP